MNNGLHFRPTRAEIDLAALTHNARVAREQAGERKVLGVIKADGYGHGVTHVALAIVKHVDAFAVAFIDEALVLRNAGFNQPIVLLEGCFSEAELPVCAHHDLQPVMHCQQQLDAILTTRLSRPLHVWLKVDTGMHRLGWHPDQVVDVAKQLSACEQVASFTLMSHYANADQGGHPLNQQQTNAFDALQATAGSTSSSLINSSALLNDALTSQNASPSDSSAWCRVGIMLYGVNPATPTHLSKALKPTMRLVAPVIATRRIRKGDSVGYGSTWQAERDSVIATVAIGYADGYPRHAANGTPAMVNGQRASLAGRVSMDMITLDVTDCGEVAVGDEVELWGPQVSVVEVAQQAGTISYELFAGLTPRVPRHLI